MAFTLPAAIALLMLPLSWATTTTTMDMMDSTTMAATTTGAPTVVTYETVYQGINYTSLMSDVSAKDALSASIASAVASAIQGVLSSYISVDYKEYRYASRRMGDEMAEVPGLRGATAEERKLTTSTMDGVTATTTITVPASSSTDASSVADTVAAGGLDTAMTTAATSTSSLSDSLLSGVSLSDVAGSVDYSSITVDTGNDEVGGAVRPGEGLGFGLVGFLLVAYVAA
jgi:hypothetical protein